MTPTSDITLIARAEAVHLIAGHLADRDRYVIVAPPDVVEALADSIGTIPDWTAYLDTGIALVTRTSAAAAMRLSRMLLPTAAVVTVPKTVPPAAISEALDHDVPADGSQDVIILADPEQQMDWPLLFVDAVAMVDPRLATVIRANDIRNLS
ncbi:MAG: hypothetical protein JWO67_989 [Streptosporangiaceae bacterium]|nr:hypothetical protein [Streptosporangiaceae bacterium]